MAKSKVSMQDSTDRKSAKRHPDAKLIAACVEYGFTMGGTHDAFDIDPTSDADFCNETDSKCLEKGRTLLATAAKQKAETIDGLMAKAKTVLMLMNGRCIDRIGPDELPFVQSFAEDVARLHSEASNCKRTSPTGKPFASVIVREAA